LEVAIYAPNPNSRYLSTKKPNEERMRKIKIGNKHIGEGEPCFIIAEAGVNHNGSIDLAKKLIDAAKDAGADAVKFQTWKTENIILKDVEMAEYQKENLSNKSEKSQFEMLKKLELPYDWHFELKEYAEELGLMFFSTMEDKESIDFLVKELKISLIKVGSGDLTNYPLLKHTARFGIPMVLSTGMATLSEIDEAVRTVLNGGNKDIILLQCTTQYPCPYEDVNLRVMLSLKEAFKTVVGFSDHSLGIECAVAAVALGAQYIEKHFTLDRNLPGPDHKSSLEPEEFKRMVTAMRNTEKALGDGIKRPMPSELGNKKITRKKNIAASDVKKDEILNEENITFKRANYGLDAKYYTFIEGKRAKKNIRRDEVITLNFVEE
jgi:N-acetylneuraminate synthase